MNDLTRAYMRLWAASFVEKLKAVVATLHYMEGRRSEPPPDEDDWLAWLEDDESYPGSFVWLCGLFDCSPERVRTMVFEGRLDQLR